MRLFCKRRQQDPGDWERLFLPIQGCLLETDRETYRAFYRDQERARYLAGWNGSLAFCPWRRLTWIRKWFTIRFMTPKRSWRKRYCPGRWQRSCGRLFPQLRPAERTLLFQLYCENRTERELAERYGVCRNAIHKRKVRILKKLKNFLHG